LYFCDDAWLHTCIYIYMCRYLLLPDQNYLSEWCIQKSESEREKSACVTQGIIIKIDARLCGLFQFRHELHTPTTSTCRHTIDDRDHAKRKLSLDAIARKREREEKVFFFFFFFTLSFFSQLIRRRKKRESTKLDFCCCCWSSLWLTTGLDVCQAMFNEKKTSQHFFHWSIVLNKYSPIKFQANSLEWKKKGKEKKISVWVCVHFLLLGLIGE
jgi:hypothetical protein